MTALTRKYQKIFGGDLEATNNIAQFGSLKAGSVVYSDDPDTIQDLAGFGLGWAGATVNNQSPALQDMNALFYLITRQMAYMFERGIPEWNSETTYYVGSIVQSSGVIYYSITNDNLNNAVTDVTNWLPYLPYTKTIATGDYTTDNYNLTNTDNIGNVSATTGATNRTITLPAAAAANKNRKIIISKADSGAGILTAVGTISGYTNIKLYKQFESIEVVSDGVAWTLVNAKWASGIYTPNFAAVTNMSTITNGRTSYTRLTPIKIQIEFYHYADPVSTGKSIYTFDLPIDPDDNFSDGTQLRGSCGKTNSSESTSGVGIVQASTDAKTASVSVGEVVTASRGTLGTCVYDLSW